MARRLSLASGLLLALVVVLSCAACAAPPDKELSQAQGAIEAARAAGAASYAVDDLGAAEAALSRARQAVVERDYRAALGQALESNARAQAAAKAAVEGRVQAQVAAERTLAEATALVTELTTRLGSAEARRVPARVRQRAMATAAAASAAIEQARDAVRRGELDVASTVAGQLAAVKDSLTALAQPPTPAPGPRRRR